MRRLRSDCRAGAQAHFGFLQQGDATSMDWMWWRASLPAWVWRRRALLPVGIRLESKCPNGAGTPATTQPVVPRAGAAGTLYVTSGFEFATVAGSCPLLLSPLLRFCTVPTNLAWWRGC